MTDKPILFSGPMVRALLAGTKTQTRRALKPQPHEWKAMVIDILPPCQDEDGNWGQVETVWSGPLIPGMCEPDHEEWHPIRHHRVGDRLWVREHWRTANVLNDIPPRDLKSTEDATINYTPIRYEADGATVDFNAAHDPGFGRFRHGMHMPRWASRITLHVTDVRVHRLQEISTADAIAEGIEPKGLGYAAPGMEWLGSPEAAYRRLWNSINGDDAWDANPWVAATTFSVELCNIDQARAAA